MLIYRLSRRSPEKIAVIDSDLAQYTYHDLNCMADALSKMFPVPSPSRVGVLAHSGIQQIAAIIAIVKNGAAYVPLDPALNGSALRRAAAASEVDFVFADAQNIGRLGDIPAVELPVEIPYLETEDYAPISLDKKSVACAMPTIDGTYQQLNGIAVRRHARSLADEFGISSSDVVLQSSVATSPMFLAEVFATLMRGATLAILPEKNRGYAKAIADFAERAGVTVICGYVPMVNDLGLLSRLPSKLRMMLAVASDRLSAALTGFNKTESWRGWSSITFGR